MKKVITCFLLFSFLIGNFSAAFAQEELPDLPTLPSLDIYTDSADVFSPSTKPAQVAPKQTAPVQTPVQPKVQAQQKSVQSPPKAVPQTITPVKKNAVNNNNSYYKNNIKSSIVVRSGKKFKVKLSQSVSDTTPEGAHLNFVSIYPESSTYVTIPLGTVFRGRITDSHPPYIGGNGGLIVIKVDEMVYKEKTYAIDAKVSVANGKHIFLNNIKGKRQYFQSIPKAMKPGSKFFKKMWRVTCNLAKNESGVEIILTPFSLLTGGLVYAVNLVASPVLALFYKGKSITIPANSQFTIQLRKDVIL